MSDFSRIRRGLRSADRSIDVLLHGNACRGAKLSVGHLSAPALPAFDAAHLVGARPSANKNRDADVAARRRTHG